jgi:hypothetical protein
MKQSDDYVWDNEPMRDYDAVGDGYDVTTGKELRKEVRENEQQT